MVLHFVKIVLNITGNGVATELKIENSTFYNTILTKRDSKEINELGIIISIQPNNIIAFKNLKIENVDSYSTCLTYENNNIQLLYNE